MSRNKAEQQIEDKLIADVAQLKRDVREIKGIQPIGSDVLKVVGAPDGGALLGGPFTIIAGSSSTIAITTIPVNEILTLWNFAFTIYVDVLDAAHQWPNGTSLTSESRELFLFNWFDWADSSDTSNSRVYKIRLRNSSPAATTHDYYIDFRAYFPKGQVS